MVVVVAFIKRNMVLVGEAYLNQRHMGRVLIYQISDSFV